jgi:hypothetical protein
MIMRFRGGDVGHKSTRTATDQFLDDRDRAERNSHEEYSHTADQDDDSQHAGESEAELQQPCHEIEPRIEVEVDPEDDCDYGYSKQVVNGDEEDEDGWQDDDEDFSFFA